MTSCTCTRSPGHCWFPSTTIARRRPLRFCWWWRFLSVVKTTSNPAASAAANRAPFFLPVPALLPGSFDGVTFQKLPERHGRCLIEQDQHLRGIFRASVEAAGRKFDHRLDLFALQTVEPFQDVVDIGARLEVLEDSRNRHPGALQNPCAADFAGNAFDRGAL